MPKLTASDLVGRNNGLDMPRLEMSSHVITLSGYFSFQAFSYLLSINDIASIRVIYRTVAILSIVKIKLCYYLLFHIYSRQETNILSPEGLSMSNSVVY